MTTAVMGIAAGLVSIGFLKFWFQPLGFRAYLVKTYVRLHNRWMVFKHRLRTA